MTGSNEIWSAVMKQLRCIEVDTFEQMIDVMMLATSYKMPTGHRVGFLGAGGGTSVLFTDLAYVHGLTLPALDSKDTGRHIDKDKEYKHMHFKSR